MSGPQIDAMELGVLLAVCALGLRGQADDIQPGNAVAGLLASHSYDNEAAQNDTVTVRMTLADICREIGRDPDDGSAHRLIRRSLRRLSSIVVAAGTADGGWAQTHLIARTIGHPKRGHPVTITLSYRLTNALLGIRSYARIRMGVYRLLTPVSRVLLYWLSCWYGGAYGSRRIRLDRLATHVWGHRSTPNRKRRQQLRQALDALPRTEWEWRALDGYVDKIEIIRHRATE